MVEYDFVLEVQDLDVCDQKILDACFEAGLDDALIYSSCGRSMVGFIRSAASYDEAVELALQDILKVRTDVAVFLNDRCIHPTKCRSIHDEWVPSRQ